MFITASFDASGSFRYLFKLGKRYNAGTILQHLWLPDSLNASNSSSSVLRQFQRFTESNYFGLIKVITRQKYHPAVFICSAVKGLIEHFPIPPGWSPFQNIHGHLFLQKILAGFVIHIFQVRILLLCCIWSGRGGNDRLFHAIFPS